VGGESSIAGRRMASAACEPTGTDGDGRGRTGTDRDEVAVSEGASGSRRGPSGREGWFAGAWVQGGARRWRVATTEGGYHCTSWSKTYSGGGCARASQSGTASTGGSSHAGGPRAGAIRGGAAGSPMWLRICCTGAASVMRATMRKVSAIGWTAAVLVHRAGVRSGSITDLPALSRTVPQCDEDSRRRGG
jgi:hypothetical protein